MQKLVDNIMWSNDIEEIVERYGKLFTNLWSRDK